MAGRWSFWIGAIRPIKIAHVRCGQRQAGGGTAIWPDQAAWQDAILFVETSEEAPSPTYVARVLRSLAVIGVLRRIAALLVGRPGGQIDPSTFADYDQAILQVIAEEQGRTDLPIITNMDFGHTDPICVLPYGVLAQVDCDRQVFAIVESAVVDAL